MIGILFQKVFQRFPKEKNRFLKKNFETYCVAQDNAGKVYYIHLERNVEVLLQN